MVRHPMVMKVNQDFVESFRNWRAPRSIHLRLLGDCMRRTILDFSAVSDQDPPNEAGMYNMSYGSAYEIWILERFRQSKLLKYGGKLGADMQVNVAVPQYGGNGYMDGLSTDNIGIEIKSVNQRKFDNIMKDRKPEKAHYYQLMAYLHFLKLEKGWLVYLDRDKHFENLEGQPVPRWEIIEIDYDPNLGKKLEKRLKKLYEHKQDGTIPDKEPKEPTDPRCTYCPHRKFCWGSLADSSKTGGTTRAKRIADASKTRRRSSSS